MPRQFDNYKAKGYIQFQKLHKEGGYVVHGIDEAIVCWIESMHIIIV